MCSYALLGNSRSCTPRCCRTRRRTRRRIGGRRRLVADNELSCDGTFNAKDLDGNGYIVPMCTAGKLVVDTTALTMCAELTMHLLLPLLTMPLPLPLLCIGRGLPSRPGTLVHVLRAET